MRSSWCRQLFLGPNLHQGSARGAANHHRDARTAARGRADRGPCRPTGIEELPEAPRIITATPVQQRVNVQIVDLSVPIGIEELLEAPRIITETRGQQRVIDQSLPS